MPRLNLKIKEYSFRLSVCCVLTAFVVSTILPSEKIWAQTVNPAGQIAALSPSFIPPTLKAVQVDINNPLKLNFVVDPGEATLTSEQLKKESEKLVRYFLAALTVPENDLWVNLSPAEKDRIIPDELGTTELGRDLLTQDYFLKQLSASLLHPDGELGKKFWEMVYQKSQELGITDLPVNALNRVWVVPQKASVYEKGDMAFVVESELKVMLDQDYTQTTNSSDKSKSTAELLRQILIPALEREVNQGQNFATLRQIYNSIILAAWYKRALKESLLGQVYADRNKTTGIDVVDKEAKQKIYDEYLKALKQGAYDTIKEDYDAATQQIVPRKYFSGGFQFDMAQMSRLNPQTFHIYHDGEISDEALQNTAKDSDGAMMVEVRLAEPQESIDWSSLPEPGGSDVEVELARLKKIAADQPALPDGQTQAAGAGSSAIAVTDVERDVMLDDFAPWRESLLREIKPALDGLPELLNQLRLKDFLSTGTWDADVAYFSGPAAKKFGTDFVELIGELLKLDLLSGENFKKVGALFDKLAGLPEMGGSVFSDIANLIKGIATGRYTRPGVFDVDFLTEILNKAKASERVSFVYKILVAFEEARVFEHNDPEAVKALILGEGYINVPSRVADSGYPRLKKRRAGKIWMLIANSRNAIALLARYNFEYVRTLFNSIPDMTYDEFSGILNFWDQMARANKITDENVGADDKDDKMLAFLAGEKDVPPELFHWAGLVHKVVNRLAGFFDEAPAWYSLDERTAQRWNAFRNSIVNRTGLNVILKELNDLALGVKDKGWSATSVDLEFLKSIADRTGESAGFAFQAMKALVEGGVVTEDTESFVRKLLIGENFKKLSEISPALAKIGRIPSTAYLHNFDRITAQETKGDVKPPADEVAEKVAASLNLNDDGYSFTEDYFGLIAEMARSTSEGGLQFFNANNERLKAVEEFLTAILSVRPYSLRPVLTFFRQAFANGRLNYRKFFIEYNIVNWRALLDVARRDDPEVYYALLEVDSIRREGGVIKEISSAIQRWDRELQALRGVFTNEAGEGEFSSEILNIVDRQRQSGKTLAVLRELAEGVLAKGPDRLDPLTMDIGLITTIDIDARLRDSSGESFPAALRVLKRLAGAEMTRGALRSFMTSLLQLDIRKKLDSLNVTPPQQGQRREYYTVSRHLEIVEMLAGQEGFAAAVRGLEEPQPVPGPGFALLKAIEEVASENLPAVLDYVYEGVKQGTITTGKSERDEAGRVVRANVDDFDALFDLIAQNIAVLDAIVIEISPPSDDQRPSLRALLTTKPFAQSVVNGLAISTPIENDQRREFFATTSSAEELIILRRLTRGVQNGTLAPQTADLDFLGPIAEPFKVSQTARSSLVSALTAWEALGQSIWRNPVITKENARQVLDRLLLDPVKKISQVIPIGTGMAERIAKLHRIYFDIVRLLASQGVLNHGNWEEVVSFLNVFLNVNQEDLEPVLNFLKAAVEKQRLMAAPTVRDKKGRVEAANISDWDVVFDVVADERLEWPKEIDMTVVRRAVLLTDRFAQVVQDKLLDALQRRNIFMFRERFAAETVELIEFIRTERDFEALRVLKRIADACLRPDKPILSAVTSSGILAINITRSGGWKLGDLYRIIEQLAEHGLIREDTLEEVAALFRSNINEDVRKKLAQLTEKSKILGLVGKQGLEYLKMLFDAWSSLPTFNQQIVSNFFKGLEKQGLVTEENVKAVCDFVDAHRNTMGELLDALIRGPAQPVTRDEEMLSTEKVYEQRGEPVIGATGVEVHLAIDQPTAAANLMALTRLVTTGMAQPASREVLTSKEAMTVLTAAAQVSKGNAAGIYSTLAGKNLKAIGTFLEIPAAQELVKVIQGQNNASEGLMALFDLIDARARGKIEMEFVEEVPNDIEHIRPAGAPLIARLKKMVAVAGNLTPQALESLKIFYENKVGNDYNFDAIAELLTGKAFQYVRQQPIVRYFPMTFLKRLNALVSLKRIDGLNGEATEVKLLTPSNVEEFAFAVNDLVPDRGRFALRSPVDPNKVNSPEEIESILGAVIRLFEGRHIDDGELLVASTTQGLKELYSLQEYFEEEEQASQEEDLTISGDWQSPTLLNARRAVEEEQKRLAQALMFYGMRKMGAIAEMLWQERMSERLLAGEDPLGEDILFGPEGPGKFIMSESPFPFFHLKEEHAEQEDSAQVAQVEASRKVGGVDFTGAKLNLQIKRDKNGIALPLNQQNLSQMHLRGLKAFVVKMTPANLPAMLGVNSP